MFSCRWGGLEVLADVCIYICVNLCICVFVYDGSYAECVLGAPVWLDRLAPLAAPGSQGAHHSSSSSPFLSNHHLDHHLDQRDHDHDPDHGDGDGDHCDHSYNP